MVDEADALVVAAGVAAFLAEEMRLQVLLGTGMLEAEAPAERHQVDATVLAAAGIAAMRAHLVAQRQHLADRVDRQQEGDLGQPETAYAGSSFHTGTRLTLIATRRRMRSPTASWPSACARFKFALSVNIAGLSWAVLG